MEKGMIGFSELKNYTLIYNSEKENDKKSIIPFSIVMILSCGMSISPNILVFALMASSFSPAPRALYNPVAVYRF